MAAVPGDVDGDGDDVARSGELSSVAFLSTMPPQKCGLATFAADLMEAVRRNDPDLHCRPVPVLDGEAGRVAGSGIVVRRQDADSYGLAGRSLRQAGTGLLCVQHEYGIFGGPDGELLLHLLDAAPTTPLVATLHTVLDHPSPNHRRVMDAVLARAARVVVMTRRSSDVIRAVHGIRSDRIEVVPHGVPLPSARSRAECRHALGVEGRPTLLTFGLLSPGKGIEHAVRALPALVRRWPNLLYVVMGATHPNLLRENGEAYRDALAALAIRLEVERNVRFVNRFVDLPELMDALAAADVYVTPYANEAQSVSGTLSYSYGLGTPVVSTPYHHAAELLADGRGVLVPFADPDALSEAVAALLSDPARRAAVREAALRDGRRMSWPRIGARYLRIFREIVARPVLAPA